MTALNETFKQLLHDNGLTMKMNETDDGYVYQGKIAMSDYHIVDFFVLLSREDKATYQVVFNNVAYCKDYNEQLAWLQVINELNCDKGVYYYFAMDKDARIFARHVHMVEQDIAQCVDVLKTGVTIVQEAIAIFTQRFGEFVVV